MNISQQFLKVNKYTRPGIRLKTVKAIAVHYAGDPGATAQNVHDYFNGTCIVSKRYASCHYTVGLKGEIIQLIPDSEISYCTNQANSYTLSIEVCHPDATGKFTEATERALIELVAVLCTRYNLSPLNGGIIRHYDVTKKICPKYYVGNLDIYNNFKHAVLNYMNCIPYILPSYAHTTCLLSSDTNGTFSMRQNATYQFKITSIEKTPTLVNGNPAVILANSFHDGIYYYFKFKAVGNVGAACGFYLNGGKTPIAIAIIK